MPSGKRYDCNLTTIGMLEKHLSVCLKGKTLHDIHICRVWTQLQLFWIFDIYWSTVWCLSLLGLLYSFVAFPMSILINRQFLRLTNLSECFRTIWLRACYGRLNHINNQQHLAVEHVCCTLTPVSLPMWAKVDICTAIRWSISHH